MTGGSPSDDEHSHVGLPELRRSSATTPESFPVGIQGMKSPPRVLISLTRHRTFARANHIGCTRVQSPADANSTHG